jgi:hypothetical protein
MLSTFFGSVGRKTTQWIKEMKNKKSIFVH